MNRYYADALKIEKFIQSINGNWRNSIYITCKVCRYKNEDCCDDILISFDENGQPIFITVKDANIAFDTIIDKSECITEMSNAKLMCILEQYIKNHTLANNVCPLLQLAKQ